LDCALILADTNFWIALSLSRHVFHEPARQWFAAQRTPRSILFCRATQQSLLRLLTQEAVMRPYDIPPLTNAGAWDMYESLLAQHHIAWAPEPPQARLQLQWKRFSARHAASSKLWMNAYLAAFAVVGKHQLVTTDGAFKQFEGLNLILLPSR
jgi:toxin-antitoxin system PIN domain toxin